MARHTYAIYAKTKGMSRLTMAMVRNVNSLEQLLARQSDDWGDVIEG